MTGQFEMLKKVVTLPVEVELTEEELWFSGNVGWARRLSSTSRGLSDRHGGEGVRINIEGARAECALAKAAGIYWDVSVNRFGSSTGLGDVGGFQVRSTKHPDGCLILHPSDDEAKRFVLVVDAAPRFRIVGAILARAGKQERFWRDPTGRGRWAFFVPQSDLESQLWSQAPVPRRAA